MTTSTSSRLPALYLGHGAPPLVDDPIWPGQLAAWAAALPRPQSILMISAHWLAEPLTIGTTEPDGLIYDFGGFPLKYYQARYDAPGTPELAEQVRALITPSEPVAEDESRGLDHGAYVPLSVMYPQADVPVLQVSIPSMGPERLYRLGQQLAPLRDEGVLIIGSGFMTHGLPYIDMRDPNVAAPAWSSEFDLWATDALTRGALDELFDYQTRAPALDFAHPTVDHFVPLFVTLGAASNAATPPRFTIDGYWYGLAKRSFEVG